MDRIIDRLLTWYFNLPADGAVDFRRVWWVEASWTWHSPLTVLLASLFFAISLLVLWISLNRHPRLVRRGVMLARILALLCVALFLIQVQLKTVTYRQPRLALLIDTSASMSLTDHYPGAQRRLIDDQVRNGSSLERLELVKQVLHQPERSWLTQAAERFEVELYTFDQRLLPQPVEALEHPDSNQRQVQRLQGLLESIGELRATGPATDLRLALQDLLLRDGGGLPAAVVLVTDGNPTTHAAGSLREIERAYRSRNLPVHTVGVGSAERLARLVIEDVSFVPAGFAGEAHPVHVAISGLTGLNLPVVLSIHRDAEDEALARLPVVPQPGNDRFQSSLSIDELSPGRNDLQVRLTVQTADGSQVMAARRLRIWGRESDLRLLMIEQSPSWEYRHIKATLERDVHLDLQAFLIESDLAYAVEDRSAINRLPDSLEEFDAVLIGDVDFRQLDSKFLEQLTNFLRLDGGGLLWISGTRSLRSLETAPPALAAVLRELHPVTLSVVSREESEPSRQQVRLSLTSEGASERIFPDSFQEQSRSQLPQLYPVGRDYQITPTALVLLQGMPTDSQLSPFPLMLSLRYGRGTVIQHLFDDSWRWRQVQQGELFRQFWSQVIRNLCRQRLLDQLPPLELVTDHDEYRTTDAISLRLLDREERFRHLESVNVQLQFRATPSPGITTEEPESSETAESTIPGAETVESRLLTLPRSPLMPELFAITLSDLQPGSYTAILDPQFESHDSPEVEPSDVTGRPPVAPADSESSQPPSERGNLPEAETVREIEQRPVRVSSPQQGANDLRHSSEIAQWRILPVQPEAEPLPMNEELLQQLARETRGNYVPLPDISELLKLIPQQTRQTGSAPLVLPLWSRWELFVLFLICIGIEWGLRRWAGME